jgi:diacylglycerol kinase (ATP)
MNAFVIVNPISGSVKDLDAVMKQLDRLGTDAIHLTRKAGDAQALARKAVRNKYDYLIAAGGDGTLNEMINGIATHARDIRVGLLPLGTGNDFARSLRLPATIEENIDVLLAGKTRAIDLVKVRSDRVRYFVNVSAGGFSGLVDEKLTPEIKRTWGPLAYVRSAAAALPELRAYRTDIELDNDEKLSVDLYNIIVANGIFVAGGLPVAPEADPCDGLLDIIIIPKRSAPEIALLAAQIVLGNHLGSEAITFRRSSRVSVNSQPGMWFNVDGELVGNEPAVFEISPRALKFVVGTT